MAATPENAVEFTDTDGDASRYCWAQSEPFLEVWCNGDRDQQEVRSIVFFIETRVIEDCTGQLELLEGSCDKVVASIEALCLKAGVTFERRHCVPNASMQAGGPTGPVMSRALRLAAWTHLTSSNQAK